MTFHLLLNISYFHTNLSLEKNVSEKYICKYFHYILVHVFIKNNLKECRKLQEKSQRVKKL